MRSSLARWLLVGMVGSIGWTAGSARAQTVTGSLFGTLTDASGARLPGVSVMVTSPQLITGQEVRQSSADGQYRFPTLPPGTYAISFELPGFQTVQRENVVLLAGQSLAVDARLQVAKLADAVTVLARPPLIDTRSAAVMNTVDSSTLDSLPIARTFTEVLNLAPGVTQTGASGSRPGDTGGTSVHGGTVRQNVYNVDGLSTNDPNVSSAVTDLPLDMFQEVQVTTAGAPAEFGEASGALFNYITKSGGNTFRGGAQFYYQSKELASSNLSSALKAVGLTRGGLDHQYDGTALVGGPIVKNRAWFFANVRIVEQSDRQSDFPAPRETTARTMFVKGTVQAASAHRAEVSFFLRDQELFPSGGSFSNAGDPRTWTGIDERDYITTASWTGTLGSRTVVEVRGSSLLTGDIFTNPNNTGAPAYMDAATGIVSGGDPTTNSSGPVERDRHQVRSSVSHFRERWLGGAHSFKAGFDWQSGPIAIRQYIRGARGADQLEGCTSGCISAIPDTIHVLFNDRPFRVQLFNTPVVVRSQVDALAAYLQDQWAVRDRVTLNVGVRADYFNGRNLESQVGGGRWQPQVTVFPEQELFNLTNVAPRLAAVWDVAGDHKTTIKASYSRFYYQLNGSNTIIANPARPGFRDYDWADSNGDRIYQPGEEGLLRQDTRPNPARLPTVDRNLKNQFNDVVSIGFERALGASWTMSVAGIIKREGDLLGIVNAAVPFSAYNPVTVLNPITGQPMTIHTLRNEFRTVQGQTVLTNPGERPGDPVKLERKYNGVELVLRHRLRGSFQFEASYVWGKGEGNVGNNPGESQQGGYTNPNALVNAYGDLSLGPQHQFKLFGSYRAPYGIVLSGFFHALSGVPVAEAATGRFRKGTATVRFFRTAYPQIQSETFIDVAAEPAGTHKFDTQTRLDFRAEKQFGVRLGTFALAVDVFNALNRGTVGRVQNLLFDTANYLLPAEVQSARQARLSLKWAF